MFVSPHATTGLARASRPSPVPNPNALLAALPPDEYVRLRRTLQLIPLKHKTVLHKPGERIQYVYFPGGGFCSIAAVLENGRMVEVATVGREGIVGVSAVWDGISSPALSIVQGETNLCFRMTADAFRCEMRRRGVFHDRLTRFAQGFLGFTMQAVACNYVHSVEQRLDRWFVMAHDRMGGAKFPVTQELIAMMLGASRPTVTVIARKLQQAGLITYRRGYVTIVDRQRLELASCKCYRTVTDLLQAVDD